jgi:hypothetical protein
MECFGILTRRQHGPLRGSWFLNVLDADGDILDTLEVNDNEARYCASASGHTSARQPALRINSRACSSSGRSRCSPGNSGSISEG